MGLDSEHRVGELVLQYWVRELGVFDWFGILAWVHWVCLFCRGFCIVFEFPECGLNFFSNVCTVGWVVSVGAEGKSSPGDSAIRFFAFLSARASWAGGVPAGGGGRMAPYGMRLFS